MSQLGMFDDEPDDHSAGGKVLFKLMGGVRGGADFYGDRKQFRPVLWRTWGTIGAPYVAWIGMNPSVASPDVDDPTVRAEQDWTRNLGFTSYRKLNISDYRSTDPKAFNNPTVPAEGAENERYIQNVCKSASLIIAAWGKPPARLLPLAARTASMLALLSVPVRCLGTTKDGFPRHPLYVKRDTKLMPFNNPTGGG